MSKTVWAGKFLTVQTEGTWEFAARQGEIAAAVIVAIDDGDVILVEQFRVPLGRSCLELPAGLVGDGGGDGDENITVHRVALADVPAFVAEKRAAGVAIDTKMLLILAGSIL